MNNTSLNAKIIKSLREVAVVDVEEGGAEDRSKITFSRLKLEEITRSYDAFYKLVNKCWSSLPEPPCKEKTYLFVWVIMCDDYCINHNTISWDNANAKTYIHVWSIIDRIRMSLDNTEFSRLIGSRSCPQFCRYVNASGALDMHIYRPEMITPSQITGIQNDMFPPTYNDNRQEFCSYYDFCMSTTIPTTRNMLNVSEISLRNQEIIRTRKKRGE